MYVLINTEASDVLIIYAACLPLTNFTFFSVVDIRNYQLFALEQLEFL